MWIVKHGRFYVGVLGHCELQHRARRFPTRALAEECAIACGGRVVRLVTHEEAKTRREIATLKRQFSSLASFVAGGR